MVSPISRLVFGNNKNHYCKKKKKVSFCCILQTRGSEFLSFVLFVAEFICSVDVKGGSSIFFKDADDTEV